MSRPWPHPKTGVFYLRMRVPADIVGLVGKAVEKVSLRTKDPATAKRVHAEKLAMLLERWEKFREGARPLSPQQINEITGDFYRAMVEDAKQYQPSSLFSMSASITTQAYIDNPYDAGFAQGFRNLYGRKIDELLWSRGVLLDPRQRAQLDLRVAEAIIDALKQTARILDNDFRPDPDAGKFPLPPPPPPPVPPVLELSVWLDKWSECLAPSSFKRWSAIITDLMTDVGHNDLARVTDEHIADFIEKLERKGGRSPFDPRGPSGGLQVAVQFYRWQEEAENQSRRRIGRQGAEADQAAQQVLQRGRGACHSFRHVETSVQEAAQGPGGG